MARTFWLETLGCPKNQVDSDKLAGTLLADGMSPAPTAEDADLVVVNTCAFVEDAREESVATILDLDDRRSAGSRLVVTGCLAERYGDELAEELPEADQVSGFGVPVTLGPRRGAAVVAGSAAAVAAPTMDLLELPRPRADRPWAYVKVAEGCDKACGFCAIPSFRGPQRSRAPESVLAEVDSLAVREVVLVAQDLAAYGRDRTGPRAGGRRQLAELYREVESRVDRVRLLYLYPSELTDELVELVAGGRVPYFDLSLQHVSAPLLRRMRRWGDSATFLDRIRSVRERREDATFRSNFIVGYPGETEQDHDLLLAFVEEAQLDWCGFFAYSAEEGTHAAGLDGAVDAALVSDRLAELRELQDAITASRRDGLVGTRLEVLVDEPGVARSHHEAPEIDGIVEVPESLAVGELHTVEVASAAGPDLSATSVSGAASEEGRAAS